MKLLSLAPCLLLLVYCSAEETATTTEKPEAKQTDSKAETTETPQKPEEPATEGNVPSEIRQFFERQQFAPEIYGLTYVQPQGGQPSLARLQPQLVLYGGQGQPILINPGNPPGNFLIPQAPGPNVLVRNPAPQGPGFPIAGYPKPAHVPPIEKDAEEVPTNPSKVPPFTAEKPKSKPKPKPEKLETFTEQNVPEQNTKSQRENPQGIPETVSLRPGQRFFFLNGDNLFNYPIEEQPQVQNDLLGLRYTQVQQSLYPQKFLQPFAQEPPQFVQDEGNLPLPVPNLLLRNSFVNTQQKPNQPQENSQEEENNDKILRTAQQYFRTGPAPISLYTPLTLPYLGQQEGITGFLGQPIQEGPNFKNAASNEIVQPQLFGQFRFTPNAPPEAYQFRDDIDNEAIVVDATFDTGVNSDQGDTNLKVDQSEGQEPEETQEDSEATMAQAGPQATAIAGPGGVAGSAPRATAIVGKGGLAVSSPQATAVAGTTDEDKKTKPNKKET